jgi:arsenite methyltransferase
MAELTAPDATATDSCCAPEQQATCCEPSAKADCCGHDEGCGCDLGTPDIRETVRARKPSAPPA